MLLIDAADQFFAVSQQSKKNRSSAPLKNRVGHTVLVGLSIVKLVGSIIILIIKLVGPIDL